MLRINKLTIQNYRSVKSVTLERCRNLNVLIGKNNAGKSNVLNAIHVLFSIISSRRVVHPSPPTGKELDYYEKNNSLPIEIGVTLALSSESVRSILEDIASEAPQIRSALDALNDLDLLTLKLAVRSKPRTYAVVEEISLSSKDQTKLPKILLAISREAADELALRAALVDRLRGDAEALKEWVKRSQGPVFRRRSESEVPTSYFLRDLKSSEEVRLRVEGILGGASDWEDASVKASGLVSELEKEAQETLQAPTKVPLKTFAGEGHHIPTYVLNLLADIGKQRAHYQTERRKQIGRNEANQLLDLKTRRGGPDVFRRIQETVNALLGVQIDAFRGDSYPRSDDDAELDVDNFLVQVNGSGVKEALRLILDYELEKPSILLVEEPETHLHPALESSLMRYLHSISADCQVFITTHSTNFLDAAGISNVYLVAKKQATEIAQLNVEETEAVIPRELGLRMSTLFMYDRLVFVEGRTDESVIREWASLLGINLSQAGVGFVRMGGARNFSYYAASSTLALLTKRNVQCWIILDRDEREEEEIARFEQLTRTHAFLHVLRGREIENYLLVPRAIAAVIQLKSSGRQVPEEETVAEQLANAVTKLRSLVIHKRTAKRVLSTIYPSDSARNLEGELDTCSILATELTQMESRLQERRPLIQSIYAEQATEVNDRWPSESMLLVPGEEVLDAIFRENGFRYNKDVDGARISSVMNISEIHPEVRELIVSLTAVAAI